MFDRSEGGAKNYLVVPSTFIPLGGPAVTENHGDSRQSRHATIITAKATVIVNT